MKEGFLIRLLTDSFDHTKDSGTEAGKYDWALLYLKHKGKPINIDGERTGHLRLYQAKGHAASIVYEIVTPVIERVPRSFLGVKVLPEIKSVRSDFIVALRASVPEHGKARLEVENVGWAQIFLKSLEDAAALKDAEDAAIDAKESERIKLLQEVGIEPGE